MQAVDKIPSPTFVICKKIYKGIHGTVYKENFFKIIAIQQFYQIFGFHF